MKVTAQTVQMVLLASLAHLTESVALLDGICSVHQFPVIQVASLFKTRINHTV